ncbi:phage tail length tape measure family protein [Solimicrobium silvestre]|uniref:Prophage tail length tape measure protein n=1 Tax=Solimicrobium silvestre TaxID=2099400 RepID=A0A2S9GY86_9BURK|nr:phage tail length tape measure family protein [Solimicrobium silvestre]PRC92679.1 Prophage tail length tape measure protein [Solimicrobium silvestre]
MSDSVDIQTLGIAVVATGATEATAQVKDFGDAANAAGEKVKGVTAPLAQLNENLTITERAAAAAAASANRLAIEQQALGRSTSDLSIGAQVYLDKLREQALAAQSGLSSMAAQAEALGIAKSEYEPLIEQIEAATASSHKLSFATAGVTRELGVMAGEIARGNYARLEGSMMTLANRTGLLTMLLDPLVLGVAAVGGAFIAAGVLAIKGAEEFNAINLALNNTGNSAGRTAAQLMDMSKRVGGASGDIGQAREALTLLAATGRISGDNLEEFGNIAVAMAKSTGSSVGDVVKSLAGLSDDALKWSENYQKQHHFMTGAAYDLIKSLHDEGDEAAAVSVVLQTLEEYNNRMAPPKEAGTISKWWESWVDVIHQASEGLKSIGVPNSNFEQINIALQKRTELETTLNSAKSSSSATYIAQIQGELNANLSLINSLRDVGKAELQKAKDQQTAGASGDHKIVNEAYLSSSQNASPALQQAQALLKDTAAYKQAIIGYKSTDEEYILAVQRHNANQAAIVDSFSTKDKLSDYDKLTDSLKVQLAEQELLLSADGKLSAGEKERAKILQELNNGTISLTASQLESVQAKLAEIIADQQALQIKNDDIKAAETLAATRQKAIDSLITQAEKLENSSKVQGKANSLIEEETSRRNANELAVKKETLALMEQQNIGSPNSSMGKDIDAIKLEIDYLGQLSAAQHRVATDMSLSEQATAADKASKELDKYLDPHRAQQFGASMKAAFGSAGAALGGLIDALGKYDKAQEESDKARINAKKELDAHAVTDIQYQQRLADITNMQAQQQIGSYADMAQAASGYFDKNSTGYTIMQDAEKAYRAISAALAMEDFLVKSGLQTSFLGLFAASKATAAAIDTAATGDSVANSMIRASADGIAAFVKTLASIPYPFNLVAAASVAAIVVGMGVKLSAAHAGGESTSASDQAATGTGTVLGDPTGKSDSVNASLKLIAANSTSQLSQTGQLLTAFNSLSATLANMTTTILQSAGIGIAGGVNSPVSLTANSSEANSLNSMLNTVRLGVGDSITTKITNAVSNAIFGGSQTLTGQGISSNNATVAQVAAGGFQASSYANISTSGGWFHGDSNSTQTNSLGSATNQQFSLAIGQMASSISDAASLIGISGPAFTANLNNFVVSIGKIDTKGMTTTQVEAALQTAFAAMGDKMATWAVAGIGKFTQAGEGALQTLVRVATDYATIDSDLAGVGMTFGAVGLASVGARENLISLAGGLTTLTSGIQFVQSNFMNQAQQSAPLVADLTQKMGALGLGAITTQAQFLALYQSLNLNTAAGQSMLVSLNQIAPEFQQVSDYQTALAAGTLKLTSQQTAAQTTLQNAYSAQATALNSVISAMGSFATATDQFRTSLQLGSLSTLTPAQQYAAAQQQYQSVLGNLNSSDPTTQANAQGQLQSASTAFLTASQTYNASSVQYQSDYAKVQANLAAVVTGATAQSNTATQQLAALNTQVAGLITVNASVLTVQQGTIAVTNAVNAMNASLGTNLTAAVNALIAQVAAQSNAQAAQTAASIAANNIANANAAKTIADRLDVFNPTNGRTRIQLA